MTEKINEYTIKYQYGTYSGERTVFATDEESAIAKMWRQLSRDMSLGMAYKSATVIDTVYNV